MIQILQCPDLSRKTATIVYPKILKKSLFILKIDFSIKLA
jgi:hypothetical protein